MTEKEKMINGNLYLAGGDELKNHRQKAKELTHEYNTIHPKELERKNEIIKNLFGETKEHFYVEAPFRCDYGYNISIGESFYSNYNLTILDCAKVTIGDNVLIAPNVSIYTAGHPTDKKLRTDDFEYALPITIGNAVWIGGNVVLNPGVTIGDDTIIGSGSVVTKNIPFI